MIFTGDSSGEAKKFIYWSDNTFSDLLNYFKGIYDSAKNVDLVQEVIMFLLSRVTKNPNIYFGAIAAIFAFFYLKSIEHIYDDHLLSGNQNALIHLLFFSFLLPIFYISGSRWALATWIFFYSLYRFFVDREWKFIFLALTSIFVHFSFIGPSIIMLAYLILGRRNILFYGLIIISFFLRPLILNYFSQIESDSFIGVQERIAGYLNEETIELRQESLEGIKWYVDYPIKMIWVYLIIGIMYARRRFRLVSNDILLEEFYSFSLLLFAFANSFMDIPSGTRFRMIFMLVATLYLVILFARTQLKGLSGLTLIGLIPMLLYFILEMRRGLDTLNIALALPLPIALFKKIAFF